MGGDILPRRSSAERYLSKNFFPEILKLKRDTRFFVIMGNDDPRVYERYFLDADREGIIDYVHGDVRQFKHLNVVGYTMVPPTPFRLKDWELYDVSRNLDPGDISPEEGVRTVDVDPRSIKFDTISSQLKTLSNLSDPKKTIYIFHSPPYDTPLDRAGLDGVKVDHAPLDLHVGSIAIRRFIERHQPPLTLHGHIHESRSITGQWRIRLGNTWCFNGSNDGSGIALIRFDTEDISSAELEIMD